MSLLDKIIQLPYAWGFRWGVCTVCAWSRGPIRPPSCSFDFSQAKVSSRLWPTLCAVGGEGLAVGPQGPPQPSRKVYTSIGTQLLYHIYTPPECPPHPPFSQDLAEDSILFLYYKSRTSSYRYELVKLLLGMANEGALQRASPTAVHDATAGRACFDE